MKTYLQRFAEEYHYFFSRKNQEDRRTLTRRSSHIDPKIVAYWPKDRRTFTQRWLHINPKLVAHWPKDRRTLAQRSSHIDPKIVAHWPNRMRRFPSRHAHSQRKEKIGHTACCPLSFGTNKMRGEWNDANLTAKTTKCTWSATTSNEQNPKKRGSQQNNLKIENKKYTKK